MLGSSSQDSGSSSRARSHSGWTVGMRWCSFFKWTNDEEEEAIVGRNEIQVSEDHWKIYLD
ncbi:uncharacterized protein DS421_6g174210 [Arachis hypogaea]|nr:uncharacterized protein DS421_6g174210 [Arachis hypogaea]